MLFDEKYLELSFAYFYFILMKTLFYEYDRIIDGSEISVKSRRKVSLNNNVIFENQCYTDNDHSEKIIFFHMRYYECNVAFESSI